ncbi:glycosyltransferase [bacterium]|nr:glycosyltransferase [bacterium]
MKTDVMIKGQKTLDLSIIIVNWNTKKFLDDCLESIYRTTTGISFEIYVIDNDSKDGTSAMVREKYPRVKFIQNKTNEGFAKANNRGIKKSKGDFVLLLNPDTLLMGNPLATIVDYMKNHEDVGICGCKVLNKDGSIEPACRRGIPTPKAALYRFIGLNKLFPKNPRYSKYNLTHLNPHKVSEVDAISGSFFMLRREVIEKIGLLDEKFFLYGEEIDWCYRIKNYGYKVVYNPAAEIIHYKGGSSSQNKLRSFYEFYHSMFIFHEKHFSHKSSLAVNIFVKIGIVLRAISLFLLKTGKVLFKMSADLVLITLSFTFAFVLWYFLGMSDTYTIHLLFKNIHFQSYIKIWSIVAFFMITSYTIFGMYEKTNFNHSREELFNLTVKATSLGMFMIIILNFMSRKFSVWSYPIPRSVFFIWWGLSIFFVASFRILFFSMRRKQKYVGRILLYGDMIEVGKLHDYFSELGSLRHHVVGALSCWKGIENGCPIVGDLKSINQTIDEYHINEIIVHNKGMNDPDLMKIMSQTSDRDLSIRIIPDFINYLTGNIKISRYAGIPTIQLPIKKHNYWYLSIKRGIDIGISSILLIITIPIYLLFAASKKLAGKCIENDQISFFGFGKTTLTISLDRNEHLALNKPYILTKSKLSFFSPSILYKSLTGKLSIIGPRLYPVKLDENDMLKAVLQRILSVRPGIFNPSLSHFRAAEDLETGLLSDIIYVNNISPITDIKVILDNYKRIVRN